MVFRQYFVIKKWIFVSILSSLFIVQSYHPLFAQKVQAQVKLMLERLPLIKQEKLKNFSDEIESYINSYDWTGESSDDIISITIQIYLVDNSVSYEDRYAGTCLISNNSDLQYYDRFWKFTYQPTDFLEHNETIFHPFTSFIDFYVYLIIGGEYDKYGKFLGTKYYEIARQINEQAQFNSRFNKGWDERRELINRILHEENKPFREVKDSFFLGISFQDEDLIKTRQYCKQALLLLNDVLQDNPDHKEALQFLEAHHLEFVDLFKDDQEILKKLMTMDPNHENIYRKYLKE